VLVVLKAPTLGRLAMAELAYPEVGGTAGELPSGYRHMRRGEIVGRGAAVFDRCADAVLTWEMHRGAGLRVYTQEPEAKPGAVVVTVMGLPRLGIAAPCRVVYVVQDDRRRGFAYGTLPGHPERGEEAFTVSLREDGFVQLDIAAFSRPAGVLSRLGDPVARLAQRLITDRYMAAVRTVARGEGTREHGRRGQ
jgi:uncharacterized protein (UPF0548 family)